MTFSLFRKIVYFFLPQRLIWACLIHIVPNFIARIRYLLQGIVPLWQQDKFFLTLYKDVKSVTLLDKSRAYVVYQLCKQCQFLSGSMAELGVYRGGTLRLISKLNHKRKFIYGFDTFEGFPDFDSNINHTWSQGQLKASFETLQSEICDKEVVLIKGVFPASVHQIPKNSRFCFVHLDTDLYEGTLEGCKYFFSRLVTGGILLIDDYGLVSCKGVKQAVDIFFADKKEKPVYLPTGQCFIMKI